MTFNIGDIVATFITLALPIVVIVMVFKTIVRLKKQNQEIHQKLDNITKKLEEIDKK